MTVQEKITEVSIAAAFLSIGEYRSAKLDNIICYEFARENARDMGLSLCPSYTIDKIPDNVGLFLLELLNPDMPKRRNMHVSL